MRTLVVIALVLLLGVHAFGQDGLRSPVLPEGAPFGQAPVSRDLYVIPRDFYNRPTRPALPVPGNGAFWFGPPPDNRRRTDEQRLDRKFGRAVRAELRRQPRRTPPVPGASPLPVVMSPAGPPRTFYLIDGCYAGDTRPEVSRLPERCRGVALRVVPPS